MYVMYSEVGQQVSRFSMRDDRTMFLFTFADPDANTPSDPSSQKVVLGQRFGNSGWECPQILEGLDATDELYFDRVSQIEMNRREGSWARGRVTLVGDAAFSVSLLGGQGSALRMTAAYILAGEMHRSNGDHDETCARYQQVFGPFVSMKQRAARRFAGAFAPKSTTSLFLRNQVFRLLQFPGWPMRQSDANSATELHSRTTDPPVSRSGSSDSGSQSWSVPATGRRGASLPLPYTHSRTHHARSGPRRRSSP